MTCYEFNPLIGWNYSIYTSILQTTTTIMQFEPNLILKSSWLDLFNIETIQILNPLTGWGFIAFFIALFNIDFSSEVKRFTSFRILFLPTSFLHSGLQFLQIFPGSTKKSTQISRFLYCVIHICISSLVNANLFHNIHLFSKGFHSSSHAMKFLLSKLWDQVNQS